MLLLEGLLGIGVGALTVFNPGVTALVLLFYIAIWAIATGVLEIVIAIRLRKEIEGEWMLILAGLASVAFGVLMMAPPGSGALAVLWLIGSYAIVFGMLFVLLAFKVRGVAQEDRGAPLRLRTGRQPGPSRGTRGSRGRWPPSPPAYHPRRSTRP